MTYKLTYFNLCARGEAARILFKLADQPFEDVRIDMEDWPSIKPKTPMGHLPLLDVNGVRICQSLAIYRYLAKQFGYYGDDNLSQARVDMIVDCVYEPVNHLGMVWAANEGEEKKAAGKTFSQVHLEPAFAILEKMLIENNGGNGYFVGDKLTLADIVLATMGNTSVHFSGQNVWPKFPKLEALKKRVDATPKIAQWIKARPATPF